MTLRVATVLSAREWEPTLVSQARTTAAVRVVLRAYQPAEIEERVDEIDIVVAGAEVPWVTPGQIAGWRRIGLGVVAIYPQGDRPAESLLLDAGADEVLADDTPVDGLLQAIRFLAPSIDQLEATPSGQTIAVVGPRGAPGCTEIALSLAWNLARSSETMLIDLDLAAPALAIRLGLPPRPDVTDAADGVRSTGVIPPATLQESGPLHVIVGSHRVGEPPLRPTMVEDVIDAAAASYEHVVLDLGVAVADDPLLKRADHAVLAVDGSAVGVVRGARLVAEWAGPPPALILNRVEPSDRSQIIDAAKKWTGLEPLVVLPSRPRIRSASLGAKPPDRKLRRMLDSIRVNQ